MKHFSFFLFSIISCLASIHAQTANTQYGQVQGSLTNGVYQFLGIPFAKPPVVSATDTLRWKAPQPPVPWTGIKSATAFAPVCPQKKYTQGDTTYTIEGNEDCLYLNVWSPSLTTPNKAVMVFIHGGGNQQGSASEIAGGTQLYNGLNLAKRGDVVVVTIQYRLGPLGFLVHPGLEANSPTGKSGNFAVMDQLLALQWVKNNIANFGGDSSRVMIFGESAGGVNVGNLLCTPMAAGLFHRACIQSAVPLLAKYDDAKDKGIDFVNTYIPTGSDAQKIQFMYGVPADSLVKDLDMPLAGGFVQSNWQPVMDNYFFPDFPLPLFKTGNFNHVPLMIGSNSEEMGLSAPPVVTPAMVTALIIAYVPSQYQNLANNYYPPGSNNTEARKSYVAMLTDAQFTAPVRRVASCVSLNQAPPVYRYYFTHKHTIPQLAVYGSYHGMELFYVFNNWEKATLGTGPLFKPADDSVQKAMLAYWSNFAKTGNPNGAGWAYWDYFTPAMDMEDYLEIKATPASGYELKKFESMMWDDAINFLPCDISGIAEGEALLPLRLQPNPTHDRFSIVADTELPPLSLELYNALGQKQAVSLQDGQVSISHLPQGVYLVRVQAGAKYWVGRIVKE